MAKIVGVNKKKLRLATPDVVKDVTGCLPGAVPPFGSLFEGVTTYADKSLQEQGDSINFNGGLRTHSFGISVADYLAVEKPSIEDFSK